MSLEEFIPEHKVKCHLCGKKYHRAICKLIAGAWYCKFCLKARLERRQEA